MIQNSPIEDYRDRELAKRKIKFNVLIMISCVFPGVFFFLYISDVIAKTQSLNILNAICGTIFGVLTPFLVFKRMKMGGGVKRLMGEPGEVITIGNTRYGFRDNSLFDRFTNRIIHYLGIWLFSYIYSVGYTLDILLEGIFLIKTRERDTTPKESMKDKNQPP